MDRNDIRLSVGLFSHPKILKLRRRLGDAGLCSVLQLWAWTAVNRPDGRLTGMTAEDLTLASGWTGDEQQFIDVLLELRLLDSDADSLTVHGWRDWQPWWAEAPERQRQGAVLNHQRWHVAKKRKHPDCEFCYLDSETESASDSTTDSESDSESDSRAETGAESETESTVPPSVPSVPSPVNLYLEGNRGLGEEGTTARFARVQQGITGRVHCAETKRCVRHGTGREAHRSEWDATVS
jgi:hypothetical protein